MTTRRVGVALSGGVDSAVVAALLLQQGFEVHAYTLRLLPPASGGQNAAAEDDVISTAAGIARFLGLPHTVIEARDEFARLVVRPFFDDYARGLTPNPCVRCNPLIKFRFLLESALADGCEWLATGHYARLRRPSGSKTYRLRRAVDRQKDQSYVLYRLEQAQLSRLVLPLGTMFKSEVRALAAHLALPVSNRPESQDVCFLPTLKHLAPQRQHETPWQIRDDQGEYLGSLAGDARITLGQRSGLGIATGQPIYVQRIEPSARTVIVGPEEHLYRSEVWGSEPTYPSGEPPAPGEGYSAQLRSRPSDAAATVLRADRERLYVRFDQAQRAPTPGQSVVIYQDDEVVAGAIICDSA